MASEIKLTPWAEGVNKVVWQDGEPGGTPLSAENLNYITSAIDNIFLWATNSGALTFDQLATGAGKNTVALGFPKKPGEETQYGLQDYRVLFIKGWIDKGQENNYAFTCTIPVSNLLDYGMFNSIEYDETLGQDQNAYGTITSMVFRCAKDFGGSNVTYLFCSSRMGIKKERKKIVDTTTGLETSAEEEKEIPDTTKPQGGIGRWLHNLSEYEHRDVYFQEVYGLR